MSCGGNHHTKPLRFPFVPAQTADEADLAQGLPGTRVACMLNSKVLLHAREVKPCRRF